jgi:hypothetical protein
MTQLLLQHLDAEERNVEIRSIPYSDLPEKLSTGQTDVGILCCGLRAPILKPLFADESVELLQVPYVDAFCRRRTSLHAEVIPAGFLRTNGLPIPAQDFRTVALRAQLITSSQVPVRLIEEVTRIITDPAFQRQQQLTELFAAGNEFALESPEFPVHVGASHVFNPELKPLLNPDFVEGTEGLRSFLVSIIAAAWLLRRWWRRRQLLQQEHRLDRYIKDLLQLERDQIGLDGNSPDDEAALQLLLDQVTNLRQEALAEFTAHELNEDRAVDCFIEMCHALSDKVSGKLTRYCLQHRSIQ